VSVARIEIPLRLVADEDDPTRYLPYVVVEVDGGPVEALLDSRRANAPPGPAQAGDQRGVP
jgi:hypothetical protein